MTVKLTEDDFKELLTKMQQMEATCDLCGIQQDGSWGWAYAADEHHFYVLCPRCKDRRNAE